MITSLSSIGKKATVCGALSLALCLDFVSHSLGQPLTRASFHPTVCLARLED